MNHIEGIGHEEPTELSSRPTEKLKEHASDLERSELGVENPEVSTYAGYILGSAVLTKGIKLLDIQGDPRHMEFSNGTQQWEDAPSAVREAFPMSTAGSVREVLYKMGIPESSGALETALARFTKAGITVTKAYAERAEDTIKYTTLEPNATPGEVNTFIGFSRYISPENLGDKI